MAEIVRWVDIPTIDEILYCQARSNQGEFPLKDLISWLEGTADQPNQRENHDKAANNQKKVG
ncbi:hypothetical protein SDC9_180343 [bioreactor metagenome]|uniref:Uncharacterized protein n=1 Tax=bioreactor metagenome TaxID=1076179 RepID=A0A645H2F5_9ZZZZ